MYKSMGAKHSNWQLPQNNQYDALLSLGGSIIAKHVGHLNRLRSRHSVELFQNVWLI